MPFNLLHPTTEARLIRAALTLQTFTLPQLARFAGIKIRTTRSMFSRHLDHFEQHPAQLGNRRGAKSKVYQLSSAARDAYQEPSAPPQMPFKAEFRPMLETAASALGMSEYALERCRKFNLSVGERTAQLEAAWAHCEAGDRSLRFASRLATNEKQRKLVVQNRCRAIRILKKLIERQAEERGDVFFNAAF